MKVVCIFPVTFVAQNIQGIFEEFRKKIAPQLISLGATGTEIKFAGTNYVFVPNNKEIIMDGEPKGKGILGCLKNVSDESYYVICCDGSGKIPYSKIVDVFQELISDSTIWCVMANRGKNKAIDEFRFLVERFEVYSLKRCLEFSLDIPDGQCGLWGYNTGKFKHNGEEKEITLTAEGYEIELDLLSEVLSNELGFSFIDVELPPHPSASSFKYENNLTKMKFFLKKYGSKNLKKNIPKYLGEFEITESVKEKLEDTSLKEQWDKYKKDLL